MDHKTKRNQKQQGQTPGNSGRGDHHADDRCNSAQVLPPTTGKFWKQSRHQAAAVCFFILVAVVLVFGQTVTHEFVNYDDDKYVYQQRSITGGLTARSLVWAFTTGEGRDWHPWYPLPWLSHMLDFDLYGFHAGGHHLTNVLLHIAVSILLFLVLWRMTGFLWRSAFVAVVFSIHPLRVESVAWVVERKDVLSGLFFMLTLGAYVRYSRLPFSFVRYLVLIVFYALGLMSKMMLVTVPFVMLLLDYWPLGRMAAWENRVSSFPWRLVMEKLPLLLMAAALSVATPFANIDAIPMTHRVTNAIVSYLAYIGKFLYPVGLAVFYPHPGGDLPIWKVVLSALTLGGVSAAAFVWRRRFPYLFVGWFWYVGMMVPVIGLVQVGLHAMADRYTYLPQIGLSLFLAWGAAELTASWRRRRLVLGIVSASLILILTGLAWKQTTYWRNSETLWRHALDCTTDNFRAHYNLAVTLEEQGYADAAMTHYRNAIRIKPDFAAPLNNLGMAMANLGQVDAAIDLYEKALKVEPDYAEAHNNLGNVLAGCGRVNEAIAHFRTALEKKPDLAEAHINLGMALAGYGRNDEAIYHFQIALEIKPGYATVHNKLGTILMSTGRIDEAIVHFQKALEIKPDYTEARENLNLALKQSGQR
jgi:tetratricopeptide (TPR) repeat protein